MRGSEQFDGQFPNWPLKHLQSRAALGSRAFADARIAGWPVVRNKAVVRVFEYLYREFAAYNIPLVLLYENGGISVRHLSRALLLAEETFVDGLVREAARKSKLHIERISVIDGYWLFTEASIQDDDLKYAIREMRMDKKALSKAKADFDLHVALLMKREECAKSKATMMAWMQGPEGLAKLLGALPLEKP